MSKSTKKTEAEVTVQRVHRGTLRFLVKGNSPLILNAMSAKTRQQLLMPPAKKNAAEKSSSLKHDPIQEFRDSMYYARDPESPCRIVVKSTAFKNAMRGAALDLPGATKSSIGRLTYVEGDEVAIYGVPELMMSVTRSSDIKRTPDVRSRAIIPKWCAVIDVTYIQPLLKEPTVINLVAAAGMTQGIGDWRVEKGSGNYGTFDLVGSDDGDVQELLANAGKSAQDEAIQNPVCYDSETEELISWFNAEARRRGFKVVA